MKIKQAKVKSKCSYIPPPPFKLLFFLSSRLPVDYDEKTAAA